MAQREARALCRGAPEAALAAAGLSACSRPARRPSPGSCPAAAHTRSAHRRLLSRAGGSTGPPAAPPCPPAATCPGRPPAAAGPPRFRRRSTPRRHRHHGPGRDRRDPWPGGHATRSSIVPADSGAGRRRWPPGQVQRRYITGTSADHGIGMVAALPARPLVAPRTDGPDHAHRGAALAGRRPPRRRSRCYWLLAPPGRAAAGGCHP
jgi:hypothetical protein